MSETIAAPRAANFVAGQWTQSHDGATYERRNPWRPSEVVGEFPSSGAQDVDAAVGAAAAAWPGWSALPAARRGTILARAADVIEARVEEIAQEMTREMGKPLREARAEAGRAATILRFFSGEGWRPLGQVFEQSATGSTVYTRRRPLGVVGLITPWNFPAAIPAWKLAPALAYGNTVVLKPARDSPLTGLHIARALEHAELPEGVLNVVIGRGSQVGDPLVADPRVAAISFTGSVPVGQGVRDRGAALGKSASSSSSAGTTRLSLRATRRSMRPSRRPTRVRSGRLVRSARRRAGSTSRTGSTTSFASVCWRGSRMARSAIRPIPRPRSGPWSTRASSRLCSPPSPAGTTRAAA